MSRRVFVPLLAVVLGIFAQAQQQQESRQPQLKERGQHKEPEAQPSGGKVEEQVPPEEDEAVAVKKEYAFNPLQAQKELQIGNYYFKKGSYRAAANRFQEATRWDSSLADAWLRLGEAREKQKDRKGAREAYAKYLEVAPDSKNASVIRKKIDQLGR